MGDEGDAAVGTFLLRGSLLVHSGACFVDLVVSGRDYRSMVCGVRGGGSLVRIADEYHIAATRLSFLFPVYKAVEALQDCGNGRL